ncbi:MAG TPA: DUF4410 domain-containing protein [Burkholderiales bacterium]|jgi:hypothetical protein|nr:DUF4410 domain-containing protein [Burkholderiales bacterium]
MKSGVVAALLAAALVAGGCVSGVTRAPSIQGQKPGISSSNQLASVSVTFTDDAKQKVTENLKFNPDELLSHVKRALDANSLLNSADAAKPTLEVRIKDLRVRANFTAIVFGFMAGADLVTADIIIKSPAGREIDRFEVAASYALGGIGGGQDTARMGWLYEKFAEETIKELKKQ